MDCKRCQRSAREDLNKQDWVEHWMFVTEEINDLSEQAAKLEDKLNECMYKKRVFQRLFQDAWLEVPPDTVDKQTQPWCHGYILDRIANEYRDRTRRVSAESATDTGPGSTTTTGFHLRKVLSMKSSKFSTSQSLDVGQGPSSTSVVSPGKGLKHERKFLGWPSFSTSHASFPSAGL